MAEAAPNQQLASSTPEGSTVAETVKKREGTYECPVGESANPKGGALGATPSPFRTVKG